MSIHVNHNGITCETLSLERQEVNYPLALLDNTKDARLNCRDEYRLA